MDVGLHGELLVVEAGVGEHAALLLLLLQVAGGHQRLASVPAGVAVSGLVVGLRSHYLVLDQRLPDVLAVACVVFLEVFLDTAMPDLTDYP